MTPLVCPAICFEQYLSKVIAMIIHARKIYSSSSASRFFLSLTLFLVCSFVIDQLAFAQEDFAQKYQAYQKAVNEGKAALDGKDYHTAIENYTKEIEASPFVALHYFDRGIAWHRKGDTKKAEEDFSKAIILEQRMATAYSYRGLVRMKGGDQAGALKDYSAALGLSPRDPSVHNNLAWLYATAKDEKLKDRVKALEHAVRAVEMTRRRTPRCSIRSRGRTS
jgi:Flp pilus assembly protein TadD